MNFGGMLFVAMKDGDIWLAEKWAGVQAKCVKKGKARKGNGMGYN